MLTAWGLSVETFVRMLKDFPLLDRFQPPLRGEECSTVTRDLALSWAARLTGTPDRGWTERAGCARSIGAVAYNPSQHTLEDDDDRPETPRDLLAGDTAG